MIYLDHNASGPLHPAARAAMLEVWGSAGNPHAVHRGGQRAFTAVERAREQLATLLGVEPARIIFTSGATESNAIALREGRWAVSAVEHPSVRVWGEREVPVTPDGAVEVAAVAALEPELGLALQLANHETGVIQDLRAGLERGRLHVDATQAVGRMALPTDVWRAASVAMSGHKFGGPTGVGALIVGEGFVGAGQRGGPQERGHRAGTLNVAGIVGMVAALRAVSGDEAQLLALQAQLERGLSALPCNILGGAHRLPNTTCVQFPGWEAADLVMALDLRGVACSAGAACASGSTERSPVLRAMGIAGSAVRFSTGWDTTPAHVGEALRQLTEILCSPSL